MSYLNGFSYFGIVVKVFDNPRSQELDGGAHEHDTYDEWRHFVMWVVLSGIRHEDAQEVSPWASFRNPFPYALFDSVDEGFASLQGTGESRQICSEEAQEFTSGIGHTSLMKHTYTQKFILILVTSVWENHDSSIVYGEKTCPKTRMYHRAFWHCQGKLELQYIFSLGKFLEDFDGNSISTWNQYVEISVFQCIIFINNIMSCN